MKLSFLFSFFSLSPKNSIIENGAYPVCKNCVYYQPHLSDTLFNNRIGKCTKYGKKEVVSGIIQYDFASVCRLSKYKCGITGNDFVERPELLLTINNTMQYFSENSSKSKYICEKIQSMCIENKTSPENGEENGKNEEQIEKKEMNNCASEESGNCSTEFCNECYSIDCKKKR
jgi:hypothetical protein